MKSDSPLELILASASPRRREMLAVLGLPFAVHVSGIPEEQAPAETPEAYVLRVARHKAEAVAAGLPPAESRRLVIAADTEVALDTEVLGKPATAAEARTMLARLRAREHLVLSAVVILDTESGQRAETVCSGPVAMRDYSDAELEAYIASGDPFDKAGGYAIQHAGFHPVEGFESCYASVRGLPLCHLSLALGRLGVQPPGDVPGGCQALNQYQCPVYTGILSGGAVVTVARPARLSAQ